MKISQMERSYRWLRSRLVDAAVACDKACGCGHCIDDFLTEFAFGENGVYWISD